MLSPVPSPDASQRPVDDPGYYTTPYRIGGQVVTLHVTRLDVAGALAFDRNFRMLERIYQRNSLALRLWRRKLDAIDPVEAPVVEWATPPAVNAPEFMQFAAQMRALETWNEARDEQAIAFRDLHETPDERARRLELERVDDEWATNFLTTAIPQYIALPPGQWIDGFPVTSGADLLKFFGPRIGMLFEIIAVIRNENLLTGDAKKKWRLRFGSAPSSATSTPTPSGDAPATTADAASAPAPAIAEPVPA